MNLLLLLPAFLLGLLIGALWVAIRAQARYKAQKEMLQQYQTIVQNQLRGSQELIAHHYELLNTVTSLRERCLQLELQREKLLASLN